MRELTGTMMQKMAFAGSRSLEQAKDLVDALNVFPVPDGDTGTNMYLTALSAAREVGGLIDPGVGDAAAAISMGSLMGARGNSGVILSQLFRGFAKYLDGKRTATPEELAKALQAGVETAYKAVMKPVEGTMLTVAREGAEGAMRAFQKGGDVLNIFEAAKMSGEIALAKTPELLPVLKQAGVVDAGGKGLLIILDGWLAALTGVEVSAITADVHRNTLQNVVRSPENDVEYQYCTEFLIKGVDIDTDSIKDNLKTQGDSMLVVGTPELVKVHIHTNHPGNVLEYCVEMGSLHEVQIHNMREQSEARTHALKTEAVVVTAKEFGIVAVAPGDGLAEIMRSMGVDVVIEGGQTMNPSTQDILSAIQQVNAPKIIILPNNSNIVLTARQASSLAEKEVHVTPTKSVVQGINALIAYNEKADFAANHREMDRSFEATKTGEITYAVRDSKMDDIQIKAGDILGLIDEKIELVGSDISKVALDIVGCMGGLNADLIGIFYGHDVSEEDAQSLVRKVKDRFPGCEVELQRGGQPLYYYIISVE